MLLLTSLSSCATSVAASQCVGPPNMTWLVLPSVCATRVVYGRQLGCQLCRHKRALLQIETRGVMVLTVERTAKPKTPSYGPSPTCSSTHRTASSSDSFNQCTFLVCAVDKAEVVEYELDSSHSPWREAVRRPAKRCCEAVCTARLRRLN